MIRSERDSVHMTKEDYDDEIAKMLYESGYSDKAVHYFQTQENIGLIEEYEKKEDQKK